MIKRLYGKIVCCVIKRHVVKREPRGRSATE